MDRLLDVLANMERRAIIECLISAQTPLSGSELRTRLGVPPARRAHFGRQLTRLHDTGLVEHALNETFVVADVDAVERFLQSAANTEAALDERRAKRSATAARERSAQTTRRRTERVERSDAKDGAS